MSIAIPRLRSTVATVGMYAGIAAVIVLIAVMIFFSVKQHAEWEAWCKDQGGHVDEDTRTTTGTGVDSNGNPVVTTSSDTTYFCLTEDGRILDIK